METSLFLPLSHFMQIKVFRSNEGQDLKISPGNFRAGEINSLIKRNKLSRWPVIKRDVVDLQ